MGGQRSIVVVWRCTIGGRSWGCSPLGVEGGPQGGQAGLQGGELGMQGLLLLEWMLGGSLLLL